MQLPLRRINRSIRAAVLAAALPLALHVVADANAASVVKTPGDDVTFSAAAGEDNDLTISLTNDGVIFDDAANPVTTASPGCHVVSPHSAKCSSPVTKLTVSVGDGTNKVISGVDAATTITAASDSYNEFWSGDGDDELNGGAAPDKLNGGDGNDVLNGYGGNDTLTGWDGNDKLNGGDDLDILVADNGADVLDGGPRNDIADYGARTKRVVVTLDGVANDGGRGFGVLPDENDNVLSTVEQVNGSSADDLLVGSASDNGLWGNDGDDVIEGGDGDDRLHGFAGDDVLRGGRGADGLLGDSAAGPGGDDDLTGGDGDDELDGRGGDDMLAGDAGADRFHGGDGSDTVTYAAATLPVAADLDGITYDDGPAGDGDTIAAGVENLIGGPHDDVLGGDAGVNAIHGGGGNDTVSGGAGADELFGEQGDDILRSSDGVIDVDDCGEGTDTAEADATDTRTACELPTATPGASPVVGDPTVTPAGTAPAPSAVPATAVAGPRMALGPARLRLDRRGVARVRVTCPAAAGAACRGTLALTVKRSTAGRASFAIAAGRTATVKIRVAKRWRRSLARKPIRVQAVASATAGKSSAQRTQRAITLSRAARPRAA